MRDLRNVLMLAIIMVSCIVGNALAEDVQLEYPAPQEVRIRDPFWTPLLDRMESVTIPDVLDKFEGRRVDNVGNTLRNFELVAEGHVADGGHIGFPWFDGLIYETITGCSDFLLHYPNEQTERRLDDYVDLIAAAQAADPDSYLNTYTSLEENQHRWGENGGNLRWQHDVYNSGCLVEAGVHYYKATGKTKLLEVATRLANYMYEYMVEQKHNVVPGHALPEYALLELYCLYKNEPKLASKLSVPVNTENYRRLAEFWIEMRGHTEGRRVLEAYAQDAESVFEAKTIEGHAVRATLLATGVASAALANGETRYKEAANRLWENMVGRRMFITGGVGAIHEDEKFGPDYYLPTDAYLETCAAIGAGMFSWQMSKLTGEARYMDVLERILYNSIPVAVSQKGDNYTYQNPLNADRMNRWPWHDCPCCPPMLLKMTGALPGMIYSYTEGNLYVNLLIGSEASLTVPGIGKVSVNQDVNWRTGEVKIHIQSRKPKKLRVHVRIPQWTQGEELPLGLYKNNIRPIETGNMEKGYRTYEGKETTEIVMHLDVSPRIVKADSRVEQLRGKACLASGPYIYCLERLDNESSWNRKNLAGREFYLDTKNPMTGNIPTIRSRDGELTAIPYYMIANRCRDTSYRVWVSCQENVLTVYPNEVQAHITPYLYGAGMEDVNHEIYGGFYDQQLFGESFEEEPLPNNLKDFSTYDHPWNTREDQVYIRDCKTAKLIYDPITLKQGTVEVDVRYDEPEGNGNAAGLILSTNDCGNGADNFRGYEISLHGSGKHIILGKHNKDFRSLGEFPVTYNATEWNRLKVDLEGACMTIYLNGKEVCKYEDKDNPLAAGKVGLRTYEVAVSFRNLSITKVNKKVAVEFIQEEKDQISGMWRGFSTDKAQPKYAIVEKNVLHGKQAQQLQNLSTEGYVGIDNMGLNRWGICVRKGQEFQGHVNLRGSAKHVYVALQSKDGSQEYARKELHNISSRWKKFPFELQSNATDTCARFVIYIEGTGNIVADAAELMHTGADQYKGQSLRADIADMFTQQKLTFLRYGGSMVNSPEYLYGNMRGKRDERPPYHGFWYHYSTNGFGIQEFVDFATAQNYELSFAVNIEDNPEDLAQMIRDLKGRVKYVEIGNEEVLFNGDRSDEYDHYVERFLLLTEAMLKVDSTLQFVCSAWWRPDSPNVERTFRALNGKCAYWDYHPWVDDYQSALNVEKELRRMKQKFHEWDPNTTMKCAIFEENGNTHAVRRMLCHVITQNAVRRMGDFVLTTCPANALEPYKQNDNGWNQGQIFFTPSQAWGMPPYYAQQLSSLNHEPLLVKSVMTDENPQLDITATRNEKGDEFVLHIVNMSDEGQPLCLRLDKISLPEQITQICISGDENDCNTPTEPCRIIPEEKKVNPGETVWLEAKSYTVIRF
ncbi:MAG: glycoside hydrolase family 127 protein [Bacteroidaceae bacterium]|nr:glycoside hydrolase family 127 protein [Bacteroidaceae bacterium]